jgi:hypothetical protein
MGARQSRKRGREEETVSVPVSFAHAEPSDSGQRSGCCELGVLGQHTGALLVVLRRDAC